MPTPSDQGCQRCGTCCRKGGPVLHAADRPLFSPGPDRGRVLDTSRVLTLRAGEPVHDPVAGQVRTLAAEAIKIKGRAEPDAPWTCVFLLEPDGGCAIYADRPLECRVLDCRDPAPLAAVYEQDRLARRDLLPPGHPLLEIIASHEALAPAARAVDLARRLGRERPCGAEPHPATDRDRAALARLLAADRDMRRLLAERAGLDPQDLDFLLGRPLEEVIRPLAAPKDRPEATPRAASRPTP